MNRGYLLENGVAVLEIGEALPKSKAGMMPGTHDRWLEHIHSAIADLARQAGIPTYEKAMVGFHITALPTKNGQSWDTSNRALNLVINNLKGIFFPDDDIHHMAFAAVGAMGVEERTLIFVGDFHCHSVAIMQLLIEKHGARQA